MISMLLMVSGVVVAALGAGTLSCLGILAGATLFVAGACIRLDEED